MSETKSSTQETRAAAAAAPELSTEAIMSALSKLTPAQKRALGFAGAPVQQYAGTPKLSTAIDAIPEGERGEVSKACAGALKVQTDPQAMGAAFAALQQRWPDLGIAISTNSSYRNKPIGHSLRVVVEALARKDA